MKNQLICLGASVIIWNVSDIILDQIIKYHALKSLYSLVTCCQTSKMQRKKIAIAACLFFFSEIWSILWTIEILSIICLENEKLIKNVTKSTYLFNPDYCIHLPIKCLTQKWWVTLKTRNPHQTILLIMKYSMCILIYKFIIVYNNILPFTIWTFYIMYVARGKSIFSWYHVLIYPTLLQFVVEYNLLFDFQCHLLFLCLIAS